MEDAVNKNAKVVEFKKPYVFEQEEYTSVDLSGLDKLTVGKLAEVQKQLMNNGGLAASRAMELSTEFTEALAVEATKLPVEFFELLPVGRHAKVKQMVQSALSHAVQDEDGEKHILRFAAPYTYKGEKYEQIDLSRIGELTAMDVRTAENRLAAEGVYAENNNTGYLYLCLLASMATGKDLEFFMGLPLCEAIPLKAAVNHRDFFE